MTRERKQTGGEKVIAFRVSGQTFEALERLKGRHARSWPELTLKAIAKAFGEVSEEDATDCRQVEAELRGEAPAGQAEPSEAVAETTEMVAESSEPTEVSQASTDEETAVEVPVLSPNEEVPQKLVAAVVTCKGCQERITRGTLVIKRANGYYHPSCLATSLDR
jgi:hypothetical protein